MKKSGITGIQGKDPDFFSTQILEARRFCLDLAPRPNAGLVVVSGGCEHCAPDYRIKRSDFRYFSIEFVARGKGTLHLKGKEFNLAPGSVFSYGPGVAHRIVTDRSDRLVKYFVDFSGKEARQLLLCCNPSPGWFMQTSAPGEIMSLFDDLIQNGSQNMRFSSRICSAILEHLILRLAETIVPTTVTSSDAFLTYQRCRQYVEARYMELHTIEDLARECSVVPAYLCRLFKRFDHQSPYHCLMRLKMRRAAELLLKSGHQVREVAARMGYDDPYHFSRVFKSIYRMAPKEFARLGHRGSQPG